MIVLTDQNAMHSVREAIAKYTAEPSTDGERPLRLIDLFCGAGGMLEGFRQMGFEPVWANDFNEDAARTYRKNFGDHGSPKTLVKTKSEKSKQTDEV